MEGFFKPQKKFRVARAERTSTEKGRKLGLRGIIVCVNHEVEFRVYPEDNGELWKGFDWKSNMSRFVF